MAMDWPLSREEKKKQLLRLYSDDVQTANIMLHSGGKALEALRKELDAARQTAGICCTAQNASAKDSSEVARLRAVVENASAVLRAILPIEDDEDPIGKAGAVEAAQPRRKSFGSVREQCAPSALRKADSHRNPQGGDRCHVSFENDAKMPAQSCSDGDDLGTVEVEPEPMREPEPTPLAADLEGSRFNDRTQTSASVLHWLFNVIMQPHRSLHDGDQPPAAPNDHDGSARLGSIRAERSEAVEGATAKRCELRLLLDVSGLATQVQDSSDSSLVQSGRKEDYASEILQPTCEKDQGQSVLVEQETQTLLESDSACPQPQRQGRRRARLRARMHGYAICDANGDDD